MDILTDELLKLRVNGSILERKVDDLITLLSRIKKKTIAERARRGRLTRAVNKLSTLMVEEHKDCPGNILIGYECPFCKEGDFTKTDQLNKCWLAWAGLETDGG